MDASLAREVGALYERPAIEFTAARNARAKALRKEDSELAAEVAKLPKPTAAAAAVNTADEAARGVQDAEREVEEPTQKLKES